MSQTPDPKDLIGAEFEHLESSGAAELALVSQVDALLERGDSVKVAALCAAVGVDAASKRRGEEVVKALRPILDLVKGLGLAAVLA